MKTRKDFQAIAETISKLPKTKREDSFLEWAFDFQKSNKRFDMERFATACKVVYTPPTAYVPPPPEVLPNVPEGLNFISTKKTDDSHWDIFLNGEEIGYYYEPFFLQGGNGMFSSNKEGKYHTLIRHVSSAYFYDTLYRLCLIFNAYCLNSNNTMSVDNTGTHLGYIVIKGDGLTTSSEKNTVCEHEGTYDVYKGFKKVGVKMPKFGDFTPTDKGIFIKEQLDVFYRQIAVTHATVWLNRKDAAKADAANKGKVVSLAKWYRDNESKRSWYPRWLEQHKVSRDKELATAAGMLNKGIVNS